MRHRRKAIMATRTARAGEESRPLRVALGVGAVAGIVGNAALLVLTAAGAL